MGEKGEGGREEGYWFSSAAVAHRALSRQHDVALMRTLGARVRTIAVQGGTEEVCPWVGAGGVDIVILGEVTHGNRLEVWQS